MDGSVGEEEKPRVGECWGDDHHQGENDTHKQCKEETIETKHYTHAVNTAPQSVRWCFETYRTLAAAHSMLLLGVSLVDASVSGVVL